MLPGKTYRPEDMLQLAKKRVWLVLVPLAVAAAGAALFAARLPNVYRSETVILVIPQRVPDSYVRTTVTSRLGDQLQTIRPTILSRTRLEQIIKDFDLYPDERGQMVLEDVIAMMRTKIEIDPRPQNDSFSVRYTGRDPKQVRDVTNRLANLFIDESLKNRAVLAEGTDEFLDARLQDAKQRLLETERRLADYRRDHAGELPSQFESNLQQVKNAQAQIQVAADNVNRLTERRVALARQLADLETAQAADALPGPIDLTQTLAGGTATQQLSAAIAALASLESSGLKAGHPDVEIAKRRIKELSVQVEAEAKQNGVAVTPTLSPQQQLAQKRLGEMRVDLLALDKQIASARVDEQKYRVAEEVAQSRLDAVPTRESELVALMRDYSTIDNQYKSLLAKKEDAKMSAELERRQIGEQFQVLDPAPLPERPISPNRPRIILLTAAVAFALGFALVGLIEYRDRTLKVDDDVLTVIKLPVLATVPLMRSESERRRLLIGRVLMNTGLGALVAACVAVVVYSIGS